VFKDYESLVFGVVLMATMIFMPRGLVPTLARLAGRRA
jgi:branched-chain amino acid transport system permease protein